MKIGLDIHGVIDKYPQFFKDFSKAMIAEGHEVHIITGQERENAEPTVRAAGVEFTHFFSVVDYHLNKGTEMWKDEKDTWWMDKDEWLRTKGDYCKRMSIDIHFDDSVEYKEFMPSTCGFILVPKSGFAMG